MKIMAGKGDLWQHVKVIDLETGEPIDLVTWLDSDTGDIGQMTPDKPLEVGDVIAFPPRSITAEIRTKRRFRVVDVRSNREICRTA